MKGPKPPGARGPSRASAQAPALPLLLRGRQGLRLGVGREAELLLLSLFKLVICIIYVLCVLMIYVFICGLFSLLLFVVVFLFELLPLSLAAARDLKGS